MTARKGRLLTEDRQALPEGEPSGIADIHDTLIIREGDAFFLTDAHGNVPPGNDRGLGLYHSDTRHLSGFNFYFHTSPPVVLLSTAELGFASEHVLTNPTLRTANGQVVARNRLQVRRQRVIRDVLEETMQVTNYHDEPVTLELHLELEADFANIFEVRGFERQRRGKLAPPRETADSVTYEYHGLDGVVRRTVVAFRPGPQLLSAAGAVYRVTLAHRQTWTARITVAFERGDRPARRHNRAGDRFEAVANSYERWHAGCTQVFTDNEFFNKVLHRSLSDLRMLSDETDEDAPAVPP